MGEMGLNPEEQIEFDDSLRVALGNEKLIKSRDSDVKCEPPPPAAPNAELSAPTAC
jgi:hypothetical protein